MKTNKMRLPMIILAVTIFVMAAYVLVSCIAMKPTVTEQDFAFSITYELDGETKVISEVYSVRYVGNSGYSDTKERVYYGEIVGVQESRMLVIKENADGSSICIDTQLFEDYLMGEPDCSYFDQGNFEPIMIYYDREGIGYYDEESLLAQNVKLISWEYPEAIENTFVFSHISIMSGEVVFPLLAIAILAMLAVIIFVKKEEGLVYTPVEKVSRIFNFIVGIITVPFFAVSTMLLDITGDNDNFVCQALYFTAALTVLGIAASICLRRKGYGKAGLIVQFVTPVLFILVVFLAL